MEDVQTSFQIMRLSASTPLTFMLRPLPPSLTSRAAENIGNLLEWALASMLAGEGPGRVERVRLEEVANDVKT